MVNSEQELQQVQAVANNAAAGVPMSAADFYSLSPQQQAAAQQALGYNDYWQGPDVGDDDEAAKKKLNDAYKQYMADKGLANLSPIQQFLALILNCLSGNGVDVSGFQSFFPDEQTFRHATGSSWQRVSAPAAGQAVELPDHVSPGPIGLGSSVVPPLETGVEKQGRYRLMAVATSKASNGINSEMVVVNPAGEVVWSGLMHSGAGNKVPLPGLNRSIDGKAVTAEYPINWGDVRMGRTDRIGGDGMCYSDGSAGFSFTIDNPDNLSEIGGAGRDHFRIHPGGKGVGTAGCMEFLSSNGKINSESDRQARSFANLMNSLPADQRPTGLEILNPSMLVAKEKKQEIATEKAAPATGAQSNDTSSVAPETSEGKKTAALVDPKSMPNFAVADVSEPGSAPQFKASGQPAFTGIPKKATAALA